jgi:hypothetical protein
MDFLEDKTIVIFCPGGYSENCGGITVLHYLAKLLRDKNINVKMFAHRHEQNEIFSDYINFTDGEKTIAIYPEVTHGNCLNAKYVIRWILAEVGKNISLQVLDTWDKNDLVYYFNSEKRVRNSPEKYDSIYKFLTTVYLKPNTFINYNKPRHGWCHIFKKCNTFHKNGVQIIHPHDSVELSNFSKYEELVMFFNRFEYFVCYDPLCFLPWLAGLCGCIPIIYKVDGVSKEEYFTGQNDIVTAMYYEYYLNEKYTNYPGIAYGIEDIEYARSTIHLFPDELNKQISYINNMSLDKFIKDVSQFETNVNSVEKNYF